MLAALGRELDAAREAEFPAARIAHHAATRGRDAHLQSPATAETRHAGGEHGLGEVDLPLHRGLA